MPRERHQNGWVTKVGKRTKVWKGHFYACVRQPDGSEKRVHKEKRLGLCAKLTKGQAEDALRAHIRKVASGDKIDEETNFTQYFDHYLTLKTPRWSDASRETVASIFRRHVIPVIGSSTFAALSRSDLQKLLNTLSHAGLSYSLLHKVRTYLKAIFDEAIEADLVRKTPARKLEFNSAKRPCKRHLTQDEVRRILSVAEGRDHLILRICLVAGLRPGELFALRRHDVIHNALGIDESVREGIAKDTKTQAADGLVVLPPGLALELDRWIQVDVSAPADQWLFPSQRGRPCGRGTTFGAP